MNPAPLTPSPTSPTPPTYDAVPAILSIHAMVNGFIADLIEPIPEPRMTEQPGGPEKIVNHPAWTLSHLNAYAALLLSMLTDPSAPNTAAATTTTAADAESEMARFGYGTTPIPSAAAYAPKRELLDTFKQRNALLAAAVAERHADAFPRPAPQKFQPHAPTIGHLAVTLLVAHPAHHLGQLKQWRRAAALIQTA